QTIIDAAGLASSPEKRPLEVRGGHLDLSGVTLTGGASSGGGGVYVFGSGSLDMSETAIVGNEAGSGGGIYVSGNVAVTITDSVITGNLGTSSVGGIRNDGAGTVTLT